MPRRWCFGVAVVVSTAIGGPSASAQLPPVPDPSTAPVTVPQPSVPPVTVPEVTVPPAPAPVPTPTVTTPSVTVPSVSGGSGSSGSGSSDSGAASGSGSGAASGSGSGAASGSGASGASGSGAASGEGSGASARARPRTSSSGNDPEAVATKARRRDRELRRAVLGHDGCLGRVPRAERRVLRLRAGVGIDRTRSRAEVGRLTGLDRARVGALERRGLSRLRALVADGACGAGNSAPSDADATGATPQSTAGGGPTPHVVVRGERESSTSQTPRASAAGSASRADDDRPLLHAPDSARDLAPFLLAGLLAGLVFVLVREGRRSG